MYAQHGHFDEPKLKLSYIIKKRAFAYRFSLYRKNTALERVANSGIVTMESRVDIATSFEP